METPQAAAELENISDYLFQFSPEPPLGSNLEYGSRQLRPPGVTKSVHNNNNSKKGNAESAGLPVRGASAKVGIISISTTEPGKQGRDLSC